MEFLLILTGLVTLAIVTIVLIAKVTSKEISSLQDKVLLNRNEISLRKTYTRSSPVVKFVLIIVVLLVTFLFFTYGTLDPCGILKKEIAMSIQKQGGMEQGMYALFGGVFERSIDTLTPVQCMQNMYEIKTIGHEKALSDMY